MKSIIGRCVLKEVRVKENKSNEIAGAFKSLGSGVRSGADARRLSQRLKFTKSLKKNSYGDPVSPSIIDRANAKIGQAHSKLVSRYPKAAKVAERIPEILMNSPRPPEPSIVSRAKNKEWQKRGQKVIKDALGRPLSGNIMAGALSTMRKTGEKVLKPVDSFEMFKKKYQAARGIGLSQGLPAGSEVFKNTLAKVSFS